MLYDRGELNIVEVSRGLCGPHVSVSRLEILFPVSEFLNEEGRTGKRVKI